MDSRLEYEAPQLAALFRAAPASRKQEILRLACERAVGETGLESSMATNALDLMRDEPARLAEIASSLEELYEAAYAHQEPGQLYSLLQASLQGRFGE